MGIVSIFYFCYNRNMENKNDTITTNEIMEFLKDNMVMREDFLDLSEKVSSIDQRVDSLNLRVDSLSQKVDTVDQRLTRVEALMVTKDYLDDKLADLGGEITSRMNKNLQKEKDFKITVIEILKKGLPVSDKDLQKFEELI